MPSSLTPQTILLSTYRNMNSVEKGNIYMDSDISERKDYCHITNTNTAVSFAEYSDFFEKNMSSSCTLQTSLLSSYHHMNTFEKQNLVNDSDISEQENLCNITNTTADVSFVEQLDYSKQNMLSSCTSQASLFSSYCNMN